MKIRNNIIKLSYITLIYNILCLSLVSVFDVLFILGLPNSTEFNLSICKTRNFKSPAVLPIQNMIDISQIN